MQPQNTATTHAGRVRDHLFEQLHQGRIRPGEALPAERKMAQQLGVSRHILRQALSSLQILGLVDIKPGSGAYVAETISDDAVVRVAETLVTHEGSIRKVMEVRRALEPVMARIAAERRDEGNLARLTQLISYVPETGDWVENGESTSFHREVARATGNTVFDGMMRMLITGSRRAEGLIKVVPAAKKEWECQHEEIYRAISQQDGDLAERLMREHTESVMNKVIELEQAGQL